MAAWLPEAIWLAIGVVGYIITQGQAFKDRFQNSKGLQVILILIAIFSFGFLVRDLFGLYGSINAAPKPVPTVESPKDSELATAEQYLDRGMDRALAGNHQAAIEDFTRALAMKPDLSAAFVQRGRSHAAIGQADQAIADFDRGLKIDPNSEQAKRYRSEAVDIRSEQLLSPLWQDMEARGNAM